MRWRLELSGYQYDIQYRPDIKDTPCDNLSRTCSAASDSTPAPLEDIHASLCHPGGGRLYHFVKTKNSTHSLENVKKSLFSMYCVFRAET